MRKTKKEIYAENGIEFTNANNGKIKAPVFGYIKPLMKNGNTKIGKGVFHFSTLPTDGIYTFTVNGKEYTTPGTCACTCRNEKTGKIDCYACAGHYSRHNVRASLGMNTILSRFFLDFVRRAITAQIIADKIRIIRVHVAGDFFSREYVEMWRGIAAAFPGVCFWTYTKVREYENAFNDISNFNVVKSIIPGRGYNFGECGYIIALYNELKAAGKSVYICLCEVSENAPHCYDCGACRTCDYVLFVKHSTPDYDAKKDALFPVLKALAESQKSVLIAA